MTSDSRRRLVWLIGSRVVVSTLLLGSAVVFQVNAPGTLAVDPFFFLIGLTYGLSVIYAVTLRFIDRSPWLVSLQFAVDVSPSRPSFTSPAASPATSSCCTCCRLSARPRCRCAGARVASRC